MTLLKTTRLLPASLGGGVYAAITTADEYQWLLLTSISPILLPAYRVINGYEDGDDEAVELTILGSEFPLVEVDPDDERWVRIVDEDTLAAESDTQGTVDDPRYFSIAIGVKSDAAGVPSDVYVMLTGAV